MTNFFNKQIEQIDKSKTLRFYGFALSLTHIWTFFYWNRNNFFVNAQSAINSEPLCFPFIPNCDLIRAAIPETFWTILLYAYLLLGILSLSFFYNKQLLKWGYYLLLGLTLTKLTFHLSNYNFMGNYHYMVHFISVLYLFLPHKKKTIKIFIVLFYLAAGCLKMNIDWLSGAAMIAPPYLQGRLLSFGLYYVVFLEVVFVFGLLAKNIWIRRLTLSQFIAFHIFSWHIVGFFYPLVMFCLLSIFILEDIFDNKPQLTLKSLLSLKEPITLYLCTAGFIMLQIFPFFFASDPSLTGAIRLSSLNMFDAKTVCHPIMIAHKSNESIQIQRPIKQLGVRIKCDPLLFLNQAHQLCRKNKDSKEFRSLSFKLLTKRVTETHYKKTMDFQNICDLKNPLWAEFSSKGSI